MIDTHGGGVTVYHCGRRGICGDAMNGKILELMLLAMLACLCLLFAWASDERMFAAVFAAEAACAGIEAVYLAS